MIETLEIGGLVIPVQAAGDIRQTYEQLGAVATLRMRDGTARRQTVWRKIGTRINGAGQVPPGLAGIDYDVPLTLACVAARSVQSTGNVITVPSARRTGSGYAPTGFAVVNGRYVSTPLSLVGNVATLTTIVGAQGYGVRYWPQISVYADFSDDVQQMGASWSWQIVAEEV